MPELYKPSRFNILFEGNKKRYAFNALTKALVELSDDMHDALKRGGELSLDTIPAEVSHGLLQSGLVVEQSLDELEYLRYLHLSTKYNTTISTLVITPTLDCNFGCPYCYEQYKGTRMSGNVVKSLQSYVENQARHLGSLKIRWLGGEPLLAWEEISELSNSFIKSCEDNSVHYWASMATNGYLLDEDTMETARSLRIQSMQITLDGPPHIHDKRRFLHDGTGTFDRVLDSICIATRYMTVVLRVNIDTENVDHFEELLAHLEQKKLRKDRIRLFCRPVISCYRAATCYTDHAFFAIEGKLLQLAGTYGYPYSVHPNIGSYLRCPYYHSNSWVIDSGGLCYRCPDSVGDESKSVGYLTENGSLTVNNMPGYLKSFSFDPFQFEECRTCNVLPLCFGKCVLVWERRNRESDEGCIPEKRSIEEKLKYVVGSKDQLDQFISTVSPERKRSHPGT